MTFSQKITPKEAVLLMDNGSLRPEATLGLRKIAQNLTQRSGCEVLPVSVLHSNKIDADRIAGQRADVFSTAVPYLLKSGVESFYVLPLFFGPSRALTEYLPDIFGQLSKGFLKAALHIAPALGGKGNEPDKRLADALADRVKTLGRESAPVVLVDHGSPVKAVAELRDAIAWQLSERLRRQVQPASMERRPDDIYAFNEPMLEKVLRTEGFNRGEVIVAQLFLLEGRHAGADGDIAQICAEAEKENPELKCLRTELLGSHPLIVDILLDRLKAIKPGLR